VLVQAAQQRGDLSGIVLPVRVELHHGREAVAVRVQEAGSHGAAHAEVERQPQHRHAGGLGDVRCGVRAAVVDHDDVRLGQAPAELRQRAGQAQLLVEGRHDDQHAPSRTGQRHRRTAFQ
jgi:hypothetical protein